MFRRLLAVAALVGATFAVAPSIANADAGEGVTGTTSAAMSRITSGFGFTCRLLDSGHVACWGRNNNGQLGNNDATRTSANTPVLVSGISTATTVSAGQMHACAVLADTTVRCWGRGEFGRTGDGNAASTDRLSPVTVCADSGCSSSFTGASTLALGDETTCALKTNGDVWCWGDNADWQVGRDPATNASTYAYPVQVTGLSNIKSIAAGAQHFCAILANDTMKCWGSDSAQQLGDGSNSSKGPVAVSISGVTTVKAVSAGLAHTCVIKADDVVGCWGSNWGGETGSGTGSMYETTLQTPQISSVDVTAKAISANSSNTCVITLADQVACWGRYMDGGSYRPTNFGNTNYARAVLTGSDGALAVAMGERHGCVAFAASVVKCWGLNTHGFTDGTGALAMATGDKSVDALVASMGASVPTITFTDPGTKSTATGTFELSGSSTSGVPVQWSSSTTSVCTVSSSTVTIVGPGTCTLNGDAPEVVAGNTKYFGATQATRSITVSAVAPVVSTGSSSSIGSTSATVAGTVNAALSSATASFEYSTSQSMTGSSIASAGSASGATSTAVSASLTGLSPGTTYWYRVKATNPTGTSNGSTQSFTTLGAVPTATSGSPTSVSSGRATLNGVVNANDLTTTVWFTIGTKSDLSDGKRIDYRDLSGNASTDVSVTATDLVESTRYYFRIEASNTLGTSRGDIKSFTAARPVGISVNNAAEFTNKKQVTIFATGPSGSTQVIISNDGGFGSSQTFSLTDSYAEIPWTLVASRDERLPKTVYARFVQRFGTQSSTNTDDIILDTTAPTMTGASGTSTGPSSDNVTVQGVRITAAKGAVRLTVRASDKNSGIGKVQVKGSSSGSPVDVSTGSPKASSRTVKVNTTKKKLWVRVVDRAGNVSKWVTVTVK